MAAIAEVTLPPGGQDSQRTTALRQSLFRIALCMLIAIFYQPFVPYWMGVVLTNCSVPFFFSALLAMLCCLLSFRFGNPALFLGYLFLLLALFIGIGMSGIVINHQKAYVGLMRPSPYGWIGVPFQSVYQWDHPDFAVRYSFDNNGFRHTSYGSSSAAKVICLGCSFTFGVGVNDREAYPAILSRSHWRNTRVLNCGLSGRGVGDALTILRDQMKVEAKPAAVFYGWIPNQAPRNYRRHSWHATQHTNFRLFEIIEGRLIDRGIVSNDQATLPDSPETTAAETEICVALIGELQSCCREWNIPFHFIALSEKRMDEKSLDYDRFITRIQSLGISVIDARVITGSFFQHDSHPMPDWHAKVADFVANAVSSQMPILQ